MRRWFLRILTSISLMMAIVFSVVYWKSYSEFHLLRLARSNDQLYIFIEPAVPGELRIAHIAQPSPSHGPQWRYTRYRTEHGLLRFTLGVQKSPFSTGSSPKSGDWRIPLYFPLTLSLLLPTWMLIRTIIAHRRRIAGEMINHCKKCGYDLRGTPERCPECGTVASAGRMTCTVELPSIKRRVSHALRCFW